MSQGYITKGQYNKLPSKMLDGIIKHNKSKGKKPGTKHAKKKHGTKKHGTKKHG
eukprot:COSAG02_NODE_3948_length_6001_cov_23.394844_1_plen_54_part_00